MKKDNFKLSKSTSVLYFTDNVKQLNPASVLSIMESLKTALDSRGINGFVFKLLLLQLVRDPREAATSHLSLVDNKVTTTLEEFYYLVSCE